MTKHEFYVSFPASIADGWHITKTYRGTGTLLKFEADTQEDLAHLKGALETMQSALGIYTQQQEEAA